MTNWIGIVIGMHIEAGRLKGHFLPNWSCKTLVCKIF